MAASTGIAPHRLEATWTVSEMAEALALQGCDPWGDLRADLRAALATAHIVALFTGKTSLDCQRFNLAAVLEKAMRRERLTPAELTRQHAAAMRTWATMLAPSEGGNS